jgi:hypothetical protein
MYREVDATDQQTYDAAAGEARPRMASRRSSHVEEETLHLWVLNTESGGIIKTMLCKAQLG